MIRRRSLLTAALAAGLAGCRSRPDDDLAGRVDYALDAATLALIQAQSADGSWRSRTYGALKDGLTLTPIVLKAVVFGPRVAGSDSARSRGAAYLVRRVRADGSIDSGPYGMIDPVYTASAALIALSRLNVEGVGAARAAWLRELQGRQLTEELGWGPSYLAFGAWGGSIGLPIRSADGQPADADLSSTLFAVGALRIAGLGADAPAIRKALVFVERCQNWPDEGQLDDPAFDDGGFVFTTTDTARNKAGGVGQDHSGRPRFRSYGSMTADGLRALLRCGLSPESPRVRAARGWLERHFSASRNPGAFEHGREIERESLYFYYAWSLAHAFRALGVGTLRGGVRTIPWARSLARELLRRQQQDGTWANGYTASKEDDPLIATAFAAGALANCRLVIGR